MVDSDAPTGITTMPHLRRVFMCFVSLTLPSAESIPRMESRSAIINPYIRLCCLKAVPAALPASVEAENPLPGGWRAPPPKAVNGVRRG